MESGLSVLSCEVTVLEGSAAAESLLFGWVIKRIFSGVGGKKSGEREEKRGRGRRGEEQRRMV